MQNADNCERVCKFLGVHIVKNLITFDSFIWIGFYVKGMTNIDEFDFGYWYEIYVKRYNPKPSKYIEYKNDNEELVKEYSPLFEGISETMT